MNITNEQAQLVAKVQDLGAQVEQARADAALLRRLKAAEANEKRLTADLRAAQEELAEANATQIAAESEARFSLFRDITVVEKEPKEGPGIQHMQYEITLTQMRWDGRESQAIPQVYRGWDTLPEHALEYLIEKFPERVPSSIRALNPDDLGNAFGRYFGAKRRGFMQAY
jgi:membrane-bound lytic murein transglycosylase